MERVILAHSLEAGGLSFEIEVMLVAIAAMWLGVIFFFQKSVKPIVSAILIAVSVGLGVASFVMGGGAASGEGINVAITSPRSGATVPAGKPVKLGVDIRGGRLTTSTTSDDPTAGHIHVYVDDRLVDMPTTATPDVELPPGDHTVAVEFVDAQHVGYEPPVIARVQVTATR